MTPEEIVTEAISRAAVQTDQLPPAVRAVLDRHHSDLLMLVESLHSAGHGPDAIRSLVAQLLHRYEADLMMALEGQEA